MEKLKELKRNVEVLEEELELKEVERVKCGKDKAKEKKRWRKSWRRRSFW